MAAIIYWAVILTGACTITCGIFKLIDAIEGGGRR